MASRRSTLARAAVAVAVAVAISIAGCAATPPLTAGPGAGPLYVAILPVDVTPGVVARAPESSTIRVILGSGGPREALRDALVDGVATEGYPVQGPDLTRDALVRVDREGGGRSPGELARRLGVDAVLVSELRAFDAAHMRTQSRVVIDLALRLIDRDGHVLWTGENEPKVVTVRAYRADMDYRAYLNAAVDDALGTLP